MTDSIPDAMLELIVRYFGDGPVPNFGRTLEIFERAPYQELRARLDDDWKVSDLTDLNHDLGWRWWLEGADGMAYDLRISFVGPYYLVLDRHGAITSSPLIEARLESAGFKQVERATLEWPVTTWLPEAPGLAYQYLFEFDCEIPWAT